MGKIPIANLAIKFFRQNGYKMEKDAILEGFSGLSRRFDFVIRKGKEKQVGILGEISPFVIKNWNLKMSAVALELEIGEL